MTPSPADLEIALRLVAGVAAGLILGLNRDRAGEDAGIRTLGLVALVAAMVGVMASFTEDPANKGRGLQGLLTGVGFLGAGLILRPSGQGHVRGLSTAATIWLTSAIGFAAGIGLWALAGAGLVLALLLLVLGTPLEDWIRRRAGGGGPPLQDK